MIIIEKILFGLLFLSLIGVIIELYLRKKKGIKDE